jgi:hypothetical protein
MSDENTTTTADVLLEETPQEPAPEQQEPASLAVKMLRESDGGAVVGGYLLLWGNAEERDLQDDYFTPETELMLSHYKTAPALFHHGLDQEVGLSVIGHRVEAKTDDNGVWVEDWINKSNKYWKMVKPLLGSGRLFYSPGSAPHLVEREDDGRLKSFPVVEDTLTPIPAQYRLLPVDQIKSAYKSANLDIPEMPEEQTPDEADAGASGQAEAGAQARALLLQIEIAENQ